MNYKNSNKLWKESEDRFLIQQMSLGMNAKQIYDHYGELIGRTEKAIECRISYLNKPSKERIKEDDNDTDNDIVIESIHQMCVRICNRLDTLTRQNEKLLKALDEMQERSEKQCDAYIKALYEIKTSASENAGDTKVIKNEVKRITHKMKV